MAFTGILGTGDSQLGDIILGSAPTGGAGAASFTIDAQITLGTSTVSSSFTSDAVITTTATPSLTANAVLFKSQSASFTANAVLFKTQGKSLTADAVISGPHVWDADTQSGVVTSDSSTWTLTYPTNLVNGDLILAFLAIDNDSNDPDPTWSSGWVKTTLSAGTIDFVAAKKKSDGTESGNFNLSLLSAQQGAWRIFRISAWEGTLGTGMQSSSGAVQLSTGVQGSSTLPNPPNLDPTNWATENTLWFALAAADGSPTFSAFPSSYTNTSGDVSGGADGASLGIARLILNTSAQNPGTFTISASNDWWAATLAVRPGASGGPHALYLTVDAVIGTTPSFTADAVLKRSQSSSLTADAVVSKTQTASLALNAVIMPRFSIDAVIVLAAGVVQFTADAVLLRGQSASFTADALLRRSQSSSLIANSIIRRTQTASFTADAALIVRQSRLFTADAVILGLFIQQHDRWTTHTGIDHGVDHVLARPIGTFLRGTDLQDYLIDFDERLSAVERHQQYRTGSFTLDAVLV
jgi:hypothetical protein